MKVSENDEQEIRDKSYTRLVELIAKGGWMKSFYYHKVDWFFYTFLPIFSSEFLGTMLRPHQSYVTASVTVGFISWEYEQ